MINHECVSKIIHHVDTPKATQQGDIPTKILKYNKDLSYFISASFKNAVNKGIFPNELKIENKELAWITLPVNE